MNEWPNVLTQTNGNVAIGQDKRSVPQRTDRLAEAGYVKKRKVLANHSNTSLLVHHKFVDQFEGAVQGPGEQIPIAGQTEHAPTQLFLGNNKFVRAEKEIRNAITMLESEGRLLRWSDLKVKVGAQDPAVSRLLAEGIRQLEDLGITARVRAKASDNDDRLHRCVQIGRAHV